MTRRGERSDVAGAEAFAREWLERVRQLPGLEASFELGSPVPGDQRATVVIVPRSDARLSPGRWSEFVGALQTLLETALERRGLSAGTVELVLPVGVPEETRGGGEEGLSGAAVALARMAVAHQRPFALGPMSVQERRQVHQALGDVPEVWTQSEGEGILRRLWVMPRAEPLTEESEAGSEESETPGVEAGPG